MVGDSNVVRLNYTNAQTLNHTDNITHGTGVDATEITHGIGDAMEEEMFFKHLR